MADAARQAGYAENVTAVAAAARQPQRRAVPSSPSAGAAQTEEETMSWLIGQWSALGTVAGKAALMYLTALVALRLGERRTLAQWTLIDFVTAVAVGAVVGRTAIAGSQSYVTGAVALVALVVMHRLASLLRFQPLVGKLVDHRIRVLVADGRVRRRELRRCGLTDNDLFAQLRQHGVLSLDDLRFVLYESKGEISIVAADTAAAPDRNLVKRALDDSAGYP